MGGGGGDRLRVREKEGGQRETVIETRGGEGGWREVG